MTLAVLGNEIDLVSSRPHDEGKTTKSNFKLEIEDVKQQVKELKDQLNELTGSNLRKDSKEYCDSKECIAASNNLFEWMNLDANPCEDFNEFACGNFIKTSLIPEDKKRWTASDPLEDLGKYFLCSILQNHVILKYFGNIFLY